MRVYVCAFTLRVQVYVQVRVFTEFACSGACAHEWLDGIRACACVLCVCVCVHGRVYVCVRMFMCACACVAVRERGIAWREGEGEKRHVTSSLMFVLCGCLFSHSLIVF